MAGHSCRALAAFATEAAITTLAAETTIRRVAPDVRRIDDFELTARLVNTAAFRGSSRAAGSGSPSGKSIGSGRAGATVKAVTPVAAKAA